MSDGSPHTPDAYYLPVPGGEPGVERFAGTSATVSVWADTMQHGAPPSGLLVRALERLGARPDARLTRVAIDILGPIPVAELDVRTRVERPGRNVELVVAELWTTGDDARAVARASGWRMTTVDTASAEHTVDPPLEPVADAHVAESMDEFWQVGYLQSLDWRWLAEIGCTGPGKVWARPLPALVAGEDMSPLQRLFSVADIANGVGAKLHPSEWTFLNTDLTVHVFRVPEGEWIGVSAETSTGTDGVGMCAGVLYDEKGAVGRIAQTVQIRRR